LDDWEQVAEELDLSSEQLVYVKERQDMINSSKSSFKSLIDSLLSIKKNFMTELQKVEALNIELSQCLSVKQQAKFLLVMEKNKSKNELNMFKLWNIK